MAVEWVSLVDAAELEGVEYNTIIKRITRQETKGGVDIMDDVSSSYEYIIKRMANPNGGKDNVYVAVSSLSDKAQERYAMRKKEEIRRIRAEKLKLENTAPWYVDCDFSWFMENYGKSYKKAEALAGIIEKYFEQASEHPKRKTEFCEEFCKNHTDLSSKQFRRYIARYKEAMRWAEAKELETGSSYDVFRVMSLLPPPKKGKHTKLTDDIMSDIRNLWTGEIYQQNRQSVYMLYLELVNILQARGSEYIPSYQTVHRYISELEYNYSGVKTLIAEGEREYKRTKLIKCRRDMTKLEVMELVMADAHTFDCWVEYTKADGKKTAIRPYLVGMIDARSRALVGWCICTQPNSEVIKQCCIHMIYPKKDSQIYGVPKVLYLDNGKDFTAETLTGVNRKIRYAADDENDGFYRAIGIEEIKRALPYQAWTKGQVERVFRTIIEKFTKRFLSYTGTLTGAKTSDKVTKDIKGMLERGELYTMEEFGAMFEAWLLEYHSKNHSELKKEGAKVPTPEWVFTNAPRYRKGVPPMDYVITLIGKCEIRTVYNYGIEVCGRTYMSEELAKYMLLSVCCEMSP